MPFPLPASGTISPADFARFTTGWMVSEVNNAIVATVISGTVTDFTYKYGGTSGTVVYTIRLTVDGSGNFVSIVRTV